LVQWVRQKLVEAGEIDGAMRAVWKITPLALRRLDELEGDSLLRAPVRDEVRVAQEMTLRDLANANRDQVRSRLLTELRALSSTSFEQSCGLLLQALGYVCVHVTARSADGGIDGYGSFRQGAVRINSAFQAKCWAETAVGRPEIDKLRGAIQGDFDHGVFLTTSRFTKDAEAASYKKGAISILLLDGPAIADLMIERNIGVSRQPVYLFEVDNDFFQLGDA
jgi:restriction system protein